MNAAGDVTRRRRSALASINNQSDLESNEISKEKSPLPMHRFMHEQFHDPKNQANGAFLGVKDRQPRPSGGHGSRYRSTMAARGPYKVATVSHGYADVFMVM